MHESRGGVETEGPSPVDAVATGQEVHQSLTRAHGHDEPASHLHRGNGPAEEVVTTDGLDAMYHDLFKLHQCIRYTYESARGRRIGSTRGDERGGMPASS